MSDLHEKFHPRNRRWPSGMPQSIADTMHAVQTALVTVICPHKDDRRCEFRVRVHPEAAQFTLAQHLEKSCPLRAKGTPGFEEAKEAKHNGKHEELVPVAPPLTVSSEELARLAAYDRKAGLKTYASGAVRSPNEGKIDYTLALDGPLFERLAVHLSRHAEEKGKRNWMNANSEEDFERFKESFLRHALQYLRGDTDEDHFAALLFNANGMEYVRRKLA